MCAWVPMALAITSAMTSTMAQKQSAAAQNTQNKMQYNNAVTARNANINQTNLMAVQETDAAAQKIDQNNLQARKAMSTASVSAGESGISGLSVDALLADIGSRQGMCLTSIKFTAGVN